MSLAGSGSGGRLRDSQSSEARPGGGDVRQWTHKADEPAVSVDPSTERQPVTAAPEAAKNPADVPPSSAAAQPPGPAPAGPRLSLKERVTLLARRAGENYESR